MMILRTTIVDSAVIELAEHEHVGVEAGQPDARLLGGRVRQAGRFRVKGAARERSQEVVDELNRGGDDPTLTLLAGCLPRGVDAALPAPPAHRGDQQGATGALRPPLSPEGRARADRPDPSPRPARRSGPAAARLALKDHLLGAVGPLPGRDRAGVPRGQPGAPPAGAPQRSTASAAARAQRPRCGAARRDPCLHGARPARLLGGLLDPGANERPAGGDVRDAPQGHRPRASHDLRGRDPDAQWRRDGGPQADPSHRRPRAARAQAALPGAAWMGHSLRAGGAQVDNTTSRVYAHATGEWREVALAELTALVTGEWKRWRRRRRGASQ